MMLGATALATSCVSESHSELEPADTGKGVGLLSIDLKSDLSFGTATRAVNEADYRDESKYTVEVIDSHDESKFKCQVSELKSGQLPYKLPIGYYTVKAYYGTEHPASREAFLVEGEERFEVKSGEDVTVGLTCIPTCGKLTVEFAPEMATYYSDYSVTYNGTKQLGATTTTVWAKNDTAPWYIALNKNGETVNYTINLTTQDEYVHVQGDQKTNKAQVTGSFPLKRNQAQKLSIRPKFTGSGETGIVISIVIDESVNDKPYEWEVPAEWIWSDGK